MDIIDVILGRALTPQGQIGTYAAQAAQAAQNAQNAASSAESAVSNISSITEQTTTNNELAASTLETVNSVLEDVNAALEDLNEYGINLEAVDDEIDNMIFSLSSTTHVSDNAIENYLTIVYPSDNSQVLHDLVVMYQNEGQNTNGTMTQKAITNYVDTSVGNVSTTVSEINSTVNNINGRVETIEGLIQNGTITNSINLGSENAGNVVIVGADGTLQAGTLSEESITEALIAAGAYAANDTIGLTIDYSNKTFERGQEAASIISGGEAFNTYPMYGGRIRCNVSDEGEILAWYGDDAYKEDGSYGQVMIYQPKFYYQRVPITYSNQSDGRAITKESLVISPIKRPGFKIHPLFLNEEGEEVDYVLLGAFEACAYNVTDETYITDDSYTPDPTKDMLSSVAGVKPISGKNFAFTVSAAETLASNRGTGWHLNNLRAISANQMLFAVEYGTFNIQNVIDSGLVNLQNTTGYNCAAQTGSTVDLGYGTGYASFTNQIVNGNTVVGNVAGKRAIAYRGLENPYGNIWEYVGDTIAIGDGRHYGGNLYVNTTYDYDYEDISDYIEISFYVPNSSNNYIAVFGYDERLDWAMIPISVGGNANSAVPVGDGFFSKANMNGTCEVAFGGSWNAQQTAGLFNYACDCFTNTYSDNYGARILFIPSKNAIYTQNLAYWNARIVS